MHMCVYMYVCMYVYIYIYIYIHMEPPPHACAACGRGSDEYNDKLYSPLFRLLTPFSCHLLRAAEEVLLSYVAISTRNLLGWLGTRLAQTSLNYTNIA